MRVDDRLCRHDLTDKEWQRLLPMMPANARRGRRWSDHRMVVNGIMFRTRTGCPWRDPDEAEGQGWTLSADSTVVRAHQHAAGARHELPAELVTGGTAR
jgi:transposase